MKIDVITPHKLLYSGEVSLVQFPGANGSFEVLENHAPLISLLKKGKIKLISSKNNKEEFVDITSGVVELSNNTITVLVE